METLKRLKKSENKNHEIKSKNKIFVILSFNE